MKPKTLETIAALSGAFLAGATALLVTRKPAEILFSISAGGAIGGGLAVHLQEQAEKVSSPERRPEHA